MPDYGLPTAGEGFFGTALAGGVGVLIFVVLGWVFYRRIGFEPS
jgi:hypothetical protein